MREPETVAFLDFTFHLASGDLVRGGSRMRMPQQTSRLLAFLVERAGTVVSRDELQQFLWPDGEFLDHEHAINRVITDLRSLLRDDPRKPRYIETVRKRGYRFLPPVSVTVETTISELELARRAMRTTREQTPAADTALEPSAEPSAGSALATVVEPPLVIMVAAPEIHPAAGVVPAPRTIVRIVRGLRQHFRGMLLGLCISVVAVTSAWLFKHRHGQVSAPANIIALGIAPFQADGPGAEQMSESFRLDLADALSQLPVVQIRATNSLRDIDHADSTISTLSEKLHLDMLLLGRFRVQADRCIVQFELIRTRDSLHLGSFQYEGSKDELAIIRDKIQRDLFLRLQGKSLSIQEIRGSTEDIQAYNDYLQARELTQMRNPATLAQALLHYQRALDRDPNFAQAYAGMATAHLALRYFDPADHQQQAKDLAEKALHLDPELAEAHGVLGDVAFRSEWNFALGESELRRAVEIEPHKAIYHAWLAGLLADEGRFDEALGEIDHAVADDPLWPSVYSMGSFVAGAARDNTRMLAYVHKYLSLVPDSAYTHNQLAWAYFTTKNYDGALLEWHKMAEMERDAPRIALEDRGQAAFRRGGILAYAQVRLDAMERHTVALNRHPNDFIPAEWYAFVDQPDKAIPLLQQEVQRHDGEAIQLAVNPMFENLHDDPRFQALIREVGLNLPLEPNKASRPHRPNHPSEL